MKLEKKKSLLQRRRWRIRKKITGTAERPRLAAVNDRAKEALVMVIGRCEEPGDAQHAAYDIHLGNRRGSDWPSASS